MKDLEKENGRLKRLVADLSLKKQVLKDIASGKTCKPERRRQAWRSVSRLKSEFFTDDDLTCLLNPKVVHTGECAWVIILKSLPVIKVDCGGITGKSLPIGVYYVCTDFKT
jgi:hypothetical protein